jgi:hypothetical protein
MSNYDIRDARWTCIFLREGGNLRRLPFDIVRWNVDQDPHAPKEIVPSMTHPDTQKVFEKVWTVDEVPFAGRKGKHDFGEP